MKIVYVVGHDPTGGDYPSILVSEDATAAPSEFAWYTQAFFSRQEAQKYANHMRKKFKVPHVLIAEVRVGA